MSRQPKAEGRQAGTHSGVGRRTRIVVHLMCLGSSGAYQHTAPRLLQHYMPQLHNALWVWDSYQAHGSRVSVTRRSLLPPSLPVPPFPAHFIMILPRYLLLLPPPPLSPLPASLPPQPFFLSFHWFLTAPFAPVPPSATRHTLADWFRRGYNLCFVSAYLIGCQRDIAMSARSSRVDSNDPTTDAMLTTKLIDVHTHYYLCPIFTSLTDYYTHVISVC